MKNKKLHKLEFPLKPEIILNTSKNVTSLQFSIDIYEGSEGRHSGPYSPFLLIC